MEKLDLAKTFRSYYKAGTKPEILEFGEASYLSIIGKGDPSSELFSEKIQSLYAVAYGVKFMSKSEKMDFVVPKLEGLWWFDDSQYRNISLSEAPLKIPKSQWEYKLLIRMPEHVTEQMVDQTKEVVYTRKRLSLLKEVSFSTLSEGKVVQMLHVGPFSNEPVTLKLMEEFMIKNNLGKAGLHHEIYLSDFNKTDPENLKTILREPVK